MDVKTNVGTTRLRREETEENIPEEGDSSGCWWCYVVGAVIIAAAALVASYGAGAQGVKAELGEQWRRVKRTRSRPRHVDMHDYEYMPRLNWEGWRVEDWEEDRGEGREIVTTPWWESESTTGYLMELSGQVYAAECILFWSASGCMIKTPVYCILPVLWIAARLFIALVVVTEIASATARGLGVRMPRQVDRVRGWVRERARNMGDIGRKWGAWRVEAGGAVNRTDGGKLDEEQHQQQQHQHKQQQKEDPGEKSSSSTTPPTLQPGHNTTHQTGTGKQQAEELLEGETLPPDYNPRPNEVLVVCKNTTAQCAQRVYKCGKCGKAVCYNNRVAGMRQHMKTNHKEAQHFLLPQLSRKQQQTADK